MWTMVTTEPAGYLPSMGYAAESAGADHRRYHWLAPPVTEAGLDAELHGSDRRWPVGQCVAPPLYCRRMQQSWSIREAGFPGLAVAAIRVAPFAAWCAEQGQAVDPPSLVLEYAAYPTAHGDHDVMAWPPGRNQQCWCGSGHKYKR